MKVSVWDTYVKREDGALMHFDILVSSAQTDEQIILKYGKEYLSRKSFATCGLKAKECRFCHIEYATTQTIEDINKKGYAIIEMENCH